VRTALWMVTSLALATAMHGQSDPNARTNNTAPASSFPAASAGNSEVVTTASGSETAKPAAPTAVQSQPPAYDPLLDLPPLPHNRVTLVGGTVTAVDEVFNRISVRPFGAKQQMRLGFDARSLIYRDGRPGTAQDIRSGDRVYVDTMLDGSRLFAKTIQVETSPPSGSGHGQILGYDAEARMLTLRDELSNQPVHFRLSPAAAIRCGEQACSAAALKTGSLVALDFGTQQGQAVVQQVSVLAAPGSEFSFFGRVTFVDLSRKLIAVANNNDGKTYEVSLGSIAPSILQKLHEGSEVGIAAVFDGNQYIARSLAPAAGGSSEQ